MQRQAYLLLTLTAMFWGANAVAGKYAVGHVSPMTLNTGRWLFMFLVMMAIGQQQFRSDWPVIKRNFVMLTLLGFFGLGVFTMTLYVALLYTSAINASIEQAGISMVIFLLNFLFFRAKASPAQIAGLVLSISGALLVASHGNFARLLSLVVNRGDAIMLFGLVVFSAYTVALRFKPAIHWKSLMIALSGSAFLTSLLFLGMEIGAGASFMPDLQGWLVIGFVGLFPSVLAQIFYVRGVELVGSNRSGLFVNLVPVFGTLLSIAILGEAFQLYHAVALALVFAGIWLAETRTNNRPA